METMNLGGDPKSPIDEKVAELVAMLEKKFENPEEKRQVLEYVQGELHKILPEGRWINVSTADQIKKEAIRLKTLQEKNILEDPNGPFRRAMETAKAKNKPVKAQ